MYFLLPSLSNAKKTVNILAALPKTATTDEGNLLFLCFVQNPGDISCRQIAVTFTINNLAFSILIKEELNIDRPIVAYYSCRRSVGHHITRAKLGRHRSGFRSLTTSPIFLRCKCSAVDKMQTCQVVHHQIQPPPHFQGVPENVIERRLGLI